MKLEFANTTPEYRVFFLKDLGCPNILEGTYQVGMLSYPSKHEKKSMENVAC